jgi:hypothetical protein
MASAVIVVVSVCVVGLLARPILGTGGERPLTIDHYIHVRSTVPAITGQPARIYVRERVEASATRRGATFRDRVALFVHGGGTPGEVAFDLRYQDYSWMAYLAGAGFDVFAMDLGLRAIHATARDERPVQSRSGTAVGIDSDAASLFVYAELPVRIDDDDFGVDDIDAAHRGRAR